MFITNSNLKKGDHCRIKKEIRENQSKADRVWLGEYIDKDFEFIEPYSQRCDRYKVIETGEIISLNTPRYIEKV